MLRLLTLAFCISLSFSKEVGLQKLDSNNNRIFELFADNIDSIDYKTIIATGNAVIISNDTYVMADYIQYNTQTKEAEISGNVRIYRDSNLFFKTKKAKIKLNESYSIIEPFYMQDSSNGIWISASLAQNTKKEYKFKNIILSSCNIDDPIWHIEGSSGYYDKESMLVSVWNPRIYIKNVPIMYVPYLIMSTNNKRTSGLLFPEVGGSKLDNLIYIQPIFLAIHDFWDMTFSPQVRLNRGFGINNQLRILDSYNNLFELNAGIFYSYDSYVRKYDIKNQITYGFDLNYQNDNLLSKYFLFDGDGLYLGLKYMNDLDYMRLQTTKVIDIENKIQVSKANYFLYKDDNYLGLSSKYFLDLSQIDNSDTFHTLPQIQYHKYLSQTPFKNLSYSIDIKSKNVVRQKGFGYFDNSLNMPFNLQTSILSGYMMVGANLDINAGIITLNNASNIANLKDKNSTYLSANYGLFLKSDIAKQYDKVFHTMSGSVNFINPLFRHFHDENMVFNPSNSPFQEISEAFNSTNIVSLSKQQIQLQFSQYFFGIGNIELLYHRMYQSIDLENSKFENLENEFGFSPTSNVNIYTTLFYSYYNKTIEEASISLDASVGYFRANITYFLKKKFEFYDDVKFSEHTANFLRIKLSHDFGYFTLYGNVGYDFDKQYLRDWNIAISKDIRCFGIGIRVANEIVPILTNSGSTSVRNNLIALELRFIPVTSTALSFRFKEGQ